MRAIGAEYPDITLFTSFMDSWDLTATRNAYPRPVLASESYGLLPAFLVREHLSPTLSMDLDISDGAPAARFPARREALIRRGVPRVEGP